MCLACLKRVSQTRALVSLPHESAVCSSGGGRCSYDSGDSVPTDLKTLELPLLCSLPSLAWVLPFSFKPKVKQVARTCLHLKSCPSLHHQNKTWLAVSVNTPLEGTLICTVRRRTGRWRVFTTASSFSSSFQVKYVFWRAWYLKLLMFSYHTRAFLLEDFWLGNSEASASLSKQWHIRLLKHLEGWWKHTEPAKKTFHSQTPLLLPLNHCGLLLSSSP